MIPISGKRLFRVSAKQLSTGHSSPFLLLWVFEFAAASNGSAEQTGRL